ncbi:MAG: Phage protein [Parcubacteria bacterium C7867-007]|nr:MAG: Phage protein [Parcubacteria bacterium C7867-007]
MDTPTASAKKPLLKKWWVWVLIVLGIFIIIGSIGGSDSSSSGSQSAKEEVKVEPALTVTAFKMAAEYKENEVAADAKYKGKLVEISGSVDTIGKDVLDTPFIAFSTENQYEIINRIQCMFGKNDVEVLSSVSKGQKITLRGTVSGALGNIIVKDCEIIE